MIKIEGLRILRLDATVDGVKSTHLVATRGTNFCGCADLISKNRRSACIKELFVAPIFRRRGIGTELVESALVLAAKDGCETLGLSLAKDNEKGEAFYRKLGFVFAYQYDDGSSIVVKKIREVD